LKNSLDWFTHDTGAHEHPKMIALLAQYGAAGYGNFWMLCEIIGASENSEININKKINRLALAGKLRMNSDELTEFIEFLADPEIRLINCSDGIITTDRTKSETGEN
jgi:hypothetical protein